MPDRSSSIRVSALIAAPLAAMLVLTGCGGGDDHLVSGIATSGNHGYHGAYLDDPYAVPDIALDDTAAKPFSLAASTARLKIVFFGYTNCPDICQIMMSTIAGALTRLDADQRSAVQVAFVTTDPARDTGPVLRSYLDRFNPDFVGLTGPLPTIMDLARPMKVFIAKGRKLDSGGYEVDHSTYVFAVTGTGVRVIWNQGTSPAQMASDIIKLLKSKESL